MSNQPPDGCELCPNRKAPGSDRTLGKVGAYSFALLLSFLCVAFSFERDTDGWHPKEEPPVFVWGLLLPLTATCLGVQVDLETVGAAIGRLLGK